MHLDCLKATGDRQIRSADLSKLLSIHHTTLLYFNAVHSTHTATNVHYTMTCTQRDLKMSRIHIKLLPKQAQVHHTATCMSMLLHHCYSLQQFGQQCHQKRDAPATLGHVVLHCSRLSQPSRWPVALSSCAGYTCRQAYFITSRLKPSLNMSWHAHVVHSVSAVTSESELNCRKNKLYYSMLAYLSCAKPKCMATHDHCSAYRQRTKPRACQMLVS